MSSATAPRPAAARRSIRVSQSVTRYASAVRSPRGIVGLGLLVILVAVSVLAPVLFPDGYDAQGSNSLSGPSWPAILGTDELGRDIFVRTMYGLRTDISLIFVGVPISAIIGTLLGLSGAVSSVLGNVVQRLLDIILGFPSLVLGISIVIVFSPGWISLVIAITIFGLPGFGRLARASLLRQQQQEYVIAAQVLGVSKARIMTRHILPNAIDPIIVQVAIAMVGGIFLESALSIVGLGIQPPSPSLGSLMNTGIRYLQQQPAYVIGPIIVLLLLALAFSLLADALNEAVNRR